MKIFLYLEIDKPQRISYKGGFIVLKHGKNSVSIEVWKKIKSNVWLLKLMDNKLLRTLDEKDETRNRKISKVNKTNDIDKLYKLLDSEKDGRIKKRILDKIEKKLDEEKEENEQ